MNFRFFLPAALFASLVSLSPAAALAAECPGFPARGVEIIEIFLVNNRGLARGDDDARRLLTKMIAEQMRFELGAWSIKSASPTRPPSKDSLALPVNGGPAFCNWDWQNGTSRERAVMTGQPGDFIDDQNLLPTNAVNHLGAIVQPPTQPPTQPPSIPPTQPLPSADVILRLDRIESIVREHIAQTERIKADDDKRDERLVGLMEGSRGREEALAIQLKKHDEEPTYVGKIFNHPIVKWGATIAGAALAGKYGFGK